MLGHRVRTGLARKIRPGSRAALGKGLSPHLQARQALCRKGHSGVPCGVAGQREPHRMVLDTLHAGERARSQRKDAAWMKGPEAARPQGQKGGGAGTPRTAPPPRLPNTPECLRTQDEKARDLCC